jgi:ABC-type sugar transport system ATPase subunit
MVMGDQIAVMNNGQIAEQGTPSKLYKRPANEFVARFLGEMNFVAGSLQRNGASMAVASPLGLVEVSAVDAAISGPDVKLGFRPEDIHIGSLDGALSVAATVTNSYYIGDALLCDFNVKGSQFSARLPNTATLVAGDTTTVSIRPCDFTVFPTT